MDKQIDPQGAQTGMLVRPRLDETTRELTPAPPVALDPSAPRAAYLVLTHPPELGIGTRYAVEETPLLLGRAPECDVQLAMVSVSRVHATVERAGDQVVLRDQGSCNGTHVNGEQVTETPLADGDQVTVGRAILKFLDGIKGEAEFFLSLSQVLTTDCLTGVHNKQQVMPHISRCLAHTRRTGQPLSLIMIDVDNFKKVNDTHGHLAGDLVLKEVAGRLASVLRQEEMLARYGGDEFIVVLPEASPAGVRVAAQRLHHAVGQRSIRVSELQLRISISLGVSTTETGHSSATLLIDEADRNLYQAKTLGRDRVES